MKREKTARGERANEPGSHGKHTPAGFVSNQEHRPGLSKKHASLTVAVGPPVADLVLRVARGRLFQSEAVAQLLLGKARVLPRAGFSVDRDGREVALGLLPLVNDCRRARVLGRREEQNTKTAESSRRKRPVL